jgi:GNAT superfamily N-acetyltransferase
VATFHASLALAQRVDLSEIRFCAQTARAGEPGGASRLDVGGGMAICVAPGSPLNKVLGLGLGAPVSDDDLDAIDEFYDRHEVPAQIELCPLAVDGLPARLAARGYVLQGFENQLACALDGDGDPPLPHVDDALSVEPTRSEEDEELWVDVVAQGFAVAEQLAAHDMALSHDDLRGVMRGFRHGSQTRYLVRHDGQAVGGGSAYFIDGVVGLAGTATIPSHRGRGVQHAMVARMLRDARGRADLAIATTAPGSRSQRTFERFGFRVIYTRAVFVRAFA